MPNLESDVTLDDGVLRVSGEVKPVPPWWVQGRPINSGTEHKKKLREWKEKVALDVKAKRGRDWCSDHLYAVTLQFHFLPLRNQKLDVDNFVKPVLDGLAAGLFLPDDEDPRDLETFAAHHGVDDSNFRILLIRRLRNAETEADQGVRLFVSTTGNAPLE